MDQQTATLLSQIITACAAIAGGLGGAMYTAHMNRRNTGATLEATRQLSEDKWRRAQDQEHVTWLRGQKQEAYTDFLSTVDSVVKEILGNMTERDTLLPGLHDVITKLTRLRLVGSDDTNTIAKDIVASIGDVIDIARATQKELQSGTRSEASEMALTEAMVNLYKQVAELVGAARMEFGTDFLPSEFDIARGK
ncbi:hypothetical protein [Paenarthrobacter sp. FR1]|uniref:hypothetical protein n=1 Tax=Paenarthrobacter sp. FR1 TaxID=3439548 RepID=UPI003DA555F3